MSKTNDSTTSRRRSPARLLGAALALALASAALAAAPASAAHGTPASTPFTGNWIGQDPEPPDGDGSTVRVSIGPGSHPSIRFGDEFGTVCLLVGSPVTVFTAQLTGHVQGPRMDATFTAARCGPVVVRFLIGAPVWVRLDDGGNDDPSDDRLFDGSVVFRRA